MITIKRLVAGAYFVAENSDIKVVNRGDKWLVYHFDDVPGYHTARFKTKREAVEYAENLYNYFSK